MKKLLVLLAVFALASSASATTITDNMTFEGNVTNKGTVTTTGAQSFSSTLDVSGDTTLNGNLTIGDANTDTATCTSVVLGATPFVFEGNTADAFEVALGVTDPTADNTVSIPDDTGSLSYAPTGGTTVAADSLAIPTTHSYVAKTTSAAAGEALTLANGENGQILTIDLAVDGGFDGTLTPTTKSGFTSIVFADAGDNATLMYVDDTVGWIILGTAGVAAPPVTVD